jgi:hypothetical protein
MASFAMASTAAAATGAARAAAAKGRGRRAGGVVAVVSRSGSTKRGAARFATRAAKDDDDGASAPAQTGPIDGVTGSAQEQAGGYLSQTRKRSPKPLPSSFGEGKVAGGKREGFQDPFEKDKSAATPAVASPFDMPAEAAKTPDAAPATPASPFGAPTPAAGKPASPFGAAAPAKPASPFGAEAPAKPPAAGGSPFADAGVPKAGSPFAQSTAANPFGDAAPKKSAPAPAKEEDTRSAWEKLPKPAMAQVVIVLSFTTIISLMIATFWVVVQVRVRSFWLESRARALRSVRFVVALVRSCYNRARALASCARFTYLTDRSSPLRRRLAARRGEFQRLVIA